jgi:hypothetical protein
MSPKEILIRARKLIEKPENWVRGHFYSGSAYCAVGSLFAAGIDYMGTYTQNPAYLALAKAMSVTATVIPGNVSRWNDDHTHAEVLAAFDCAIASFD